MNISNAVELSQSDNAEVGDILIFQYTILGICTASQISAVMSSLLEQPFIIMEYEKIEHNWYSDILQVKVKVKQNPIPIALLVVAISACAISFFVYLSLDKIYKIASDPTGTGTMSKLSTGFIFAAVAAVLFFVLRFFKS